MMKIFPMTMLDFFRKSEGTWFTQRSVHHFDSVTDESGESNLIVKLLECSHPKVQAICEQQGIESTLASCGASFSWQDNLDETQPNPDYAAILVDIPDDATGRTGKLLRNKGYVEKIPVICRYRFASDGVLTIDTNYDNNQGQERCWFVTDNFRVRVSTVRMMDGVNLMTYCSEFRCVQPDTLAQLIQHHQTLAQTPNS